MNDLFYQQVDAHCLESDLSSFLSYVNRLIVLYPSHLNLADILIHIVFYLFNEFEESIY